MADMVRELLEIQLREKIGDAWAEIEWGKHFEWHFK